MDHPGSSLLRSISLQFFQKFFSESFIIWIIKVLIMPASWSKPWFAFESSITVRGFNPEVRQMNDHCGNLMLPLDYLDSTDCRWKVKHRWSVNWNEMNSYWNRWWRPPVFLQSIFLKMSEKNNRVSQYGVEEMFLDRWSSRSLSPKKIDQEQSYQLFEAAHWAPSSGNRQPWRFVYATDGENRKKFKSVLYDSNAMWAP